MTALLFLAPLGVLSLLLIGFAAGSYLELLGGALSQPANEFTGADPGFAAFSGLLAFGVVGIVGFVVTLFVLLVLLVQAEGIVRGMPISLSAGVRGGLRRFWPMLGMVIVASVVMGVVLTDRVHWVRFRRRCPCDRHRLRRSLLLSNVNPDSTAAMIGLVAIVAVLYLAVFAVLLLPLGYIFARWLVAPVLIVVEHCGPIEALSRSWRLTSRSVWRLLGLLLLLGLFNFFVLSLPVVLVQWLGLALAPPQYLGLMAGAITGLSYLVNALWYPLLALTLLMAYMDLLTRREGADLLARLHALELTLRPTMLPPAVWPSAECSARPGAHPAMTPEPGAGRARLSGGSHKAAIRMVRFLALLWLAWLLALHPQAGLAQVASPTAPLTVDEYAARLQRTQDRLSADPSAESLDHAQRSLAGIAKVRLRGGEEISITPLLGEPGSTLSVADARARLARRVRPARRLGRRRHDGPPGGADGGPGAPGVQRPAIVVGRISPLAGPTAAQTDARRGPVLAGPHWRRHRR